MSGNESEFRVGKCDHCGSPPQLRPSSHEDLLAFIIIIVNILGGPFVKRCAKHFFTCTSLQCHNNPKKIIPTSQMRKLRLGEVKMLVQGHITRKWQSWNSELRCVHISVHTLHQPPHRVQRGPRVQVWLLHWLLCDSGQVLSSPCSLALSLLSCKMKRLLLVASEGPTSSDVLRVHFFL